MQIDTLTFTDFGPRHIEDALRLSRAAGWPHRAEDWALILRLSHGVVAVRDGRIVATAMATPFGPVGTLNMIIVDEALRGRGLGRRIMEEAMARAAPEEWRLVATRDGLPLYEKMGFAACGEVQQLQGVPARAEPLSAPGASGLDWATASDADALAELDRAATGMDRAALIAALLEVGRVLALRESGRIVAFAALRRFGRGEVAGPVVARDAAEAKTLLSRLATRCDGGFLRVDTTADTGLAPWLAGLGLAPAGGGIAMRRGGPVPASASHRRFALASQALG
ncbi:Acetyltransferase (GNAT) domain-containing protein [Tistlia consotensis]|uniref:Acetyltransferase (GNAT) domain-containing protein n=1 Tax=Tistlia consotensis USBA 355 TaxID=560819 RepID=A0A1Y6C180_9PROT|nr:GNAT family N-acetyltransferase [Tistlia consotensis]SMF31012.1 Acetyltransferase (GNAT) domain-containing protein [Tistlia consotensis USBA 355]SNS19392.1 Acetyltransferase (GNAT) domain-containing protein [Tistlia consotensis]